MGLVTIGGCYSWGSFQYRGSLPKRVITMADRYFRGSLLLEVVTIGGRYYGGRYY